MISFGGAFEGEEDGDELGVSVLPPPGVVVGVLDEEGLACVEGLVCGELLGVVFVFWPTVGVQAPAKRKSPATRAPALHNRPVI